jgi:hypothetical protein
MVDRVEERFDLKPQRLIADTAYGTASMLGWMVEEKISSHTCRCLIRQNVMMAPSSAKISSGTLLLMNIVVRLEYTALPMASI